MALLAALAGAAVVAGIILLVRAFQPAPPKPVAKKPTGPTLAQRWKAVSRRTKNLIVVGLVAGVITSAISGIILLVVVVPAAVVGLPLLLGKQDTRERDLLSALESWTRSLASTAETGEFTLREVIDVTRASTPAIIRVPVDRLAARMNGSWSSSAALRAFADELDSPWVDEVTIYLIQAAEFSSGGLAKALEGVADNLAVQTTMRIEIYNERDKPRRTMRTMTLIIGAVLVGIVLFSHTQQISMYRTPLGQVILAIILAGFVALLVWAKSLTRTRPEPRIILTESEGRR
ncbi:MULTISPECIES: type II secretion system F family protein [Curtobacterium]|uniref:Type II secretion system F family protein n=2 Tax=Curtobacterium TaxID=2034 RepID=A0A6N1D5Z2_9MICO|nr:type II secretion system F family protein [Curtobacterium flaccumfaciens]MBO9041470.1 type II secretion system F family protein [Curtobacterium flaccumfaciens pv. flaccumfaciens]MBO9044956.1 type II secretion system F family protein [Curtobacterium flaccumfaciens pv. flaccumfaciens]MBO9048901.1 type II secretion system F family protein [Curtobacterium flaccumfaciens pv. flaccumfaciens]MBO9057752.1 type II secretion system F family protein [Curtobacterium flaccumfaciens pv. flaccumfaciens]MB